MAKKPSKVLPGVLGGDDLSIVVYSPSGTSRPSSVLPVATSFNDGLMSSAQAAKLVLGGKVPNYTTPASLPSPSGANDQTFALVDDIGNGTAGLYLSRAGAWCFLLVVAP